MLMCRTAVVDKVPGMLMGVSVVDLAVVCLLIMHPPGFDERVGTSLVGVCEPVIPHLLKCDP